MMSSSRVRQLPPAPTILALAASVKRSAATVNLGTSISLSSSVTVATATTVLSLNNETRQLAQMIGNNGDLLFLSEMFDHFGERERWSVDPGGYQSAQDGLAELRTRSPRQELEELATKEKVIFDPLLQQRHLP